MSGISILVLFLLAGVVAPRNIGFYDNYYADEPIMSRAQEQRICAELCMSGLGGEPCGGTCQDVTPRGLPKPGDQTSQYKLNNEDEEDDDDRDKFTRRSACPVLCANRLGWPLCNCNTTTWSQPFFKANFVQICAHYCVSYEYQIYGCNPCKTYNSYSKTPVVLEYVQPYDWKEICISLCQDGDGGTACYCDLLPMSFELPPNKTLET